jgi:hypothetical protein
VIALIAAVPQREHLRGNLDTVSRPHTAGRLLRVGRRAALVVDRHYRAVARLDQVDLGNDTLGLRGYRDRPGVESLGKEVVRIGQRTRRAVHAAVDAASLDSVGAVLPFLRDVLQVVEPRAVDKLVQHARGNRVVASRVALRHGTASNWPSP